MSGYRFATCDYNEYWNFHADSAFGILYPDMSIDCTDFVFLCICEDLISIYSEPEF